LTLKYSYLYTFNYDYHHTELCKLESRQIFKKEEKNKLLFSNSKVDPSISPFIKNRFEIISSAEDYSELLQTIKKENIRTDGFKVEYLVLDGDAIEKPERLIKLKDVGYSIDGGPDYDTPWITYAICHYKNTWYFGVVIKHDADWLKHKKKPCSSSNSIGMVIAKTLVSMASKGDKTNQLLDACCGVGTVMLEACCSGIDIEGCDIKPNPCHFTRENLAHFNYTANVYNSDIKDLDKKYDAAIIDLPYNLYSYSNDTILTNIIESTAKLTARIVIVSMSDIEPIIKRAELQISDFCTVEKRGRSQFTRNIWICEKESSSN
jgi:tRNA (guanine10-N2)-dimethyltransferase